MDTIFKANSSQSVAPIDLSIFQMIGRTPTFLTHLFEQMNTLSIEH